MNKVFTVIKPLQKEDMVIMPGDDLIFLREESYSTPATPKTKIKAESKLYCWMYNRKAIKIYPSEEDLIIKK